MSLLNIQHQRNKESEVEGVLTFCMANDGFWSVVYSNPLLVATESYRVCIWLESFRDRWWLMFSVILPSMYTYIQCRGEVHLHHRVTWTVQT